MAADPAVAMPEDGVHILSWGLYLPRRRVLGKDLASRFDLPAEVMKDKIGFVAKHVPGAEDGCAAMASRAARTAMDRAKMEPEAVDLVIYCGSEYKEHVVWNAAAHVAATIGAQRALAFEVYALCAGLPIALQVARDMMRDGRFRLALVVTASREGDLVDPANPRTRWMANFGAGGGAVLLGHDGGRAILCGFSGRTGSRLSMSVVQPAGGSSRPASHETVDGRLHHLDVNDMPAMRRILEEVSLPSYIATITEALQEAGKTAGDISLLCVTAMKPSFHRQLVEALRLAPERAISLDEVGHMQSVDQIAALEIAQERNLLAADAVVVMAAAGTGYTWSAMVARWRG